MTLARIARDQGLMPHWGTDIFCRSEPTDRRSLLLHMCLRQTEIRVKILGGLLLLADWRNIGGSRFSTRSTPDSCESQTGTFSINQTIVFKHTLTLLIDFFNVHHNTHPGSIISAVNEIPGTYEPFVAAILVINMRPTQNVFSELHHQYANPKSESVTKLKGISSD